MGPITIFDKSALQSLSMDESVWLDAFFLVNVVPLFYVETLADERATTGIAFLRRAVRWLQKQGIRPQRVMTDNGSGYRAADFADACAELGLRHLRTRPYTPRTNGKAERFIQSALREWAYARAYSRSHQRIAGLPRWLHGYNWHRPHASLIGQPPITRLGLTRNNLMRLHT